MAFIIQDRVLVKYEEEANLTEVLVPSYVKSIGDFAFSDCIHLKTINIPYSVEKISFNAFDGCINLKNFNLVDIDNNYQ